MTGGSVLRGVALRCKVVQGDGLGNVEALEQNVAVDVQEFLDAAEVLRQPRVLPVLGRMAGEIDGQDDVAYARMLALRRRKLSKSA